LGSALARHEQAGQVGDQIERNEPGRTTVLRELDKLGEPLVAG